MQAIRHGDVVNPESLDIGSNHLQHMYSGRFAWYYYKRFDMILEKARIDNADTALVVGGGTGIFTLSLVEEVPDVYFVDLEQNKIEDAQSLLTAANLDHSSVNCIVGDGTRLPLPTDSVDVAFALDTLEHIPDADSAISEIERVLRPNGQIHASVPIEVGPPLAVREIYRFFDDRRQKANSITELIRGVIGRPTVIDPTGHQGYDFRKTVRQCAEHFEDVNVTYCPFPILKWTNPTAIITARSNR